MVIDRNIDNHLFILDIRHKLHFFSQHFHICNLWISAICFETVLQAERSWKYRLFEKQQIRY